MKSFNQALTELQDISERVRFITDSVIRYQADREQSKTILMQISEQLESFTKDIDPDTLPNIREGLKLTHELWKTQEEVNRALIRVRPSQRVLAS